MKLIFLTSRLPYPPDRGDRVRTYNFLRQFSREHDVTLLSFIANENERLLANELAPYCEEMHLVRLPQWKSAATAALNIWRDAPLQTLFYRSRQMGMVIEQLLAARPFDAAYVHLFRMAPYLANYPDLYRILDFTDLISYELRTSLPYQPAPWRALYRFEEPRIARYEQTIGSQFDEVWFISERDRELYGQSEQLVRQQVIPNSIDETLLLVDPKGIDSSKLLFVGHLQVNHNVDAARYLAREIMPLILSEIPACELQIVGAGDRNSVADLEECPGVRVLGFVPDLRTVFAKSAISVAPLRFSAGIQVKVVEAMAAGLPVVTTSAVCAGIGAEPGRDLLVADDAPAFAAQVVRLLRDRPQRQEVGGAGRDFVQIHFTAQTAVDRLRSIESTIGGAATT